MNFDVTPKRMKLDMLLIFLTTAMLVIVTIGSQIGYGMGLMSMLIFIGQLMLIVTVIAVLKAPVSSSKTFDEFFYEDSDYRRNNPGK